MQNDIRVQVANYYDLCPDMPADVPFYKSLVPSPEARVLELGCGTGRVLVPLAGACGYIHGPYGQGPELVIQFTQRNRPSLESP